MSAAEHRQVAGVDEDVAEWVHESRSQQGLPPTVEDDSVLEDVARIMTVGRSGQLSGETAPGSGGHRNPDQRCNAAENGVRSP
jgi:hypothetical protein